MKTNGSDPANQSAQAAVPSHPNPLPPGQGAAANAPNVTAPTAATPPLAAVLPLPAGEGRGEGERVPKSISLRMTLVCGVVGLVCFHLAYYSSLLSPLMLGYAWALVELTRVQTGRRAFLSGFFLGLGSFVPQMGFLWTIFGIPAVPLWCVLAFWIGLFVWVGRLARQQFGNGALLLLPLLWIGLEYFRSELYFLRFSWLNMGYAFAEWPLLVKTCGGVYGVGAAFMLLACFHSFCWHDRRWPLWRFQIFWLVFFPVAVLVALPPFVSSGRTGWPLRVAGIQLEFPAMLEVPPALDRVLLAHPKTDLFVLSEYTFDGAVPKRVRDWCRKNGKHLLVGGKDDLGDGRYHNTAFVVGPDGEIVFQQAKAVPIQFFKDGLPAPEQKVWNSPWGMLGICICYDSSFTRVTDELVRQGAQAIIVPVMDMTEWGTHQHELHSRVAPVRAAEYRMPVFRVCSSGISQLVSKNGTVFESAPFPGQGEIIGGATAVRLPGEGIGRLPFDRCLAWLGLAGVALTLGVALKHRFQRKQPSPATS
ncbi:MAG: Apolipoprotein N-acyltransferase-like protein [Limisphaerales bacterium]|nr:MAG: Apolipoprotein N-acyltransferase-like protein [Limisphaerales bacterium]KAG0507637.1 MAG: Apolipoprotein N-acyltransferase-like protein [Limisphaerales bacterium]TXT51756.1 MAG: Apolipoprotein N-acyltransferase-like protein [Limisphaerales bacterium]